MKIHYSPCGYNGDYTYTSVCGKKVKTHQEKEKSTIHPEQANCKDCLKTPQYTIDLKDLKGFKDILVGTRRIYIESDILQADEFMTAQGIVFQYCVQNGIRPVGRVFSEVLDFAWHDLEKTWKAVKSADEIYATSSLIPLSGGSYRGAPVIFNGMCERAIKENITGKSVIILNHLKNIEWDMIHIPVMKKAFNKNCLYMFDDNHEFVEVDVSKIKNKK